KFADSGGLLSWAGTVLMAAVNGAAFGLFPIGWIVLAAIFLYNLTVETGQFEIVKHSVMSLSDDRRVQALLIAFCFGAFIEGAAGFGTPVAISAALMMGAGFRPLHAAGLPEARAASPFSPGQVFRAWVPWLLLSVLVFLAGVPAVKNGLNRVSAPVVDVPGLHNAVRRDRPVVPEPQAEEARYRFNWL